MLIEAWDGKSGFQPSNSRQITTIAGPGTESGVLFAQSEMQYLMQISPTFA
jgi:hypothetical protein